VASTTSSPRLGLLDHAPGDPVGAEGHDPAGRHGVGLVDEHGALGPQVLDDGAVVDDLVADVDRGPVKLERPLHHRDGAGHARAEAAWLGKDHPHPPPLVSVSLGATILLRSLGRVLN